MNCDERLSLISDYLDGTLTNEVAEEFSAHLKVCPECFAVERDLAAILNAAHEPDLSEFEPPNAQAMWIRIRNAIESEQLGVRAARQAAAVSKENSEGLLARFFNRRWELSFSQLAGVVSAVVITVAIATILSLRGIETSPMQASGTEPNSERRTTVAPNSNLDSRFAAQRIAIEYWQQRVEQRKARWNPQMREAFERNISVADQAVNDSLRDLSAAPHDEVTEEMLNDALRGKIELLKEFSDL